MAGTSVARFPLPTVMKGSHCFSEVPQATIERSTFDQSHAHKTTFNAGFLIPVLVHEVLPGDTINCRMSALARLTTPLKPLMDNLYLDSFFFFVPTRLVWANWQKFNGEQANPGDSTSYLVPSLSTPFTPSLMGVLDYMGIMPATGATAVQTPNTINALPLRCYNLIYNQWFRDENLINSISVATGDGPDSAGAYGLQKRGKRHDYFTSCLPFLQKGVAQTVPLTGQAIVKTNSTDLFTGSQQSMHGLLTTGAATGAFGAGFSAGSLASVNATAFTPSAQWYPSNLYADLSTVPAAFTINAMRQAFQIQKLLERDARGGTRYTEILKAHFGVTSPDARLQRPEYLGGGSTPIVINPIVQLTPMPTTATGIDATHQGNLAATGAGVVTGHGFVKSFTEHGYIIGIVNVRADLTYQQGLERMWTRQIRYDFFWPALAHIGEQAVLNQEIYWQGTTALNGTDIAAFGYQERYAEYRYKPSRVSGLYRSNAVGTLDLWHLAEKFSALPTLAQTFIEDQTASILNRNVAVTTEPDFYFDSFFKMISARPMPVFGVPGLIDHF